MGISLNNLPAKFHPYLLGHPLCPKNKLEKEIDKVFEKALSPLKSDYIFSAGNWVLKLGRTDGVLTTDDTHLYRIRKAEKIRKYISNNNLEDHIMVPKKFLYWNENENRFYVVSKKVDLLEDVAEPSDFLEPLLDAALAKQFGGQVKAFTKGKPTRALSPEQARGLSELSILGYTDLTYNNLFYNTDGKVAIIDTEPVKRGLKKELAKNKFAMWLGDKGALLAQQSISGMAKLKMYCNSEALREVKKVEQKHVLWSIAKLIGKIAFYSFALYVLTKAVALLPIGALAVKALKISLIAIAILKILVLVLNVASVATIWKLSQDKLDGIAVIVGLEAQGAV